jgi:hypothetical protein
VSLKDDVKYVKEELSSDEKLLESAFRLERLYKKYRYLIWGIGVALLLGIGGKLAYDSYHAYRLERANTALLTLEKNPGDKAALEALRSNNPRLYALYRYARAVETQKPGELKEVTASGDPILQDLARYHEAVLADKAGESRYYPDLSKVEKAYLALKAGKKEEARQALALIGENSPVAGIARLLRHATLK